MGIFRILIFGFVIWLLWFAFKRLKLTAASIKTQKQKKSVEKTTVTTVKQCAFCSVHVPEEEAIQKNDLYYCSKAHASESH